MHHLHCPEGYTAGEWLEARRLALGKSRAELAVEIGCTERAVQHLECGDVTNPRVAMLVGTARALGLVLDELADAFIRCD